MLSKEISSFSFSPSYSFPRFSPLFLYPLQSLSSLSFCYFLVFSCFLSFSSFLFFLLHPFLLLYPSPLFVAIPPFSYLISLPFLSLNSLLFLSLYVPVPHISPYLLSHFSSLSPLFSPPFSYLIFLS